MRRYPCLSSLNYLEPVDMAFGPVSKIYKFYLLEAVPLTSPLPQVSNPSSATNLFRSYILTLSRLQQSLFSFGSTQVYYVGQHTPSRLHRYLPLPFGS